MHRYIERRAGHHDPETRFWAKVATGARPAANPSLGPCLIHSGADNGNGYVQFRYNGRGDYAHRYAWEREKGPIPVDLTVDHLCEVKRCVNIKHLQLLTAVDNYLRTKLSIQKCPNGHEYRPGSFRMRRGRRECLVCVRAAIMRDSRRRSRSLNGLPNRRIRYDQALVRQVIAEIRSNTETIAAGARRIGCNPNYLGRRTWQETRRDVLVRDKHQCCRCGEAAQDVHHRVPRGLGGSSKPDISFGLPNLISLCRGCHEWVESNREASYAQGWLVHRGTDPALTPVWVWNRPERAVLLTVEGTYLEQAG